MTAGIDDHRPVAECEALPQLVLGGDVAAADPARSRAARRAPRSARLGTPRSPSSRTYSTWNSHHPRLPYGSADHRRRGTARLVRLKYSGIRAVLQIVDRQHVRTDSPKSVQRLRRGDASRRACFADETMLLRPRSAAPAEAPLNEATTVGNSSVSCRCASTKPSTTNSVGRRCDSSLGQSEQLSNEVLLGSADITRNAPQQIDGNGRIGHQHNSRYASAVNRAVSCHVA